MYDPNTTKTVDDVRAFLRETDLEGARAVLEEETTRPDPRSTVVEAAQKRVEQLEAEAADDTPPADDPNPGVVPEGRVPDAAILPAPEVTPRQYAAADFQVGRPAEYEVVRRMDRSGALGEAARGPLAPGERGVIVVQAGDTVTAGLLRQIG